MIELKKEQIQKKGGINTMKRKSLLYIIITLVMLLQMSVGIVASDEVVVDETEIIIETDFDLIVEIILDEPELQPDAANGCVVESPEQPDVVSYSSLAMDGYPANSKIGYMSSGGSICFSLGYTNALGQIFMRIDLNPYNGIWTNWGHSPIMGSHIHYYTWSWNSFVNGYRYTETIGAY